MIYYYILTKAVEDQINSTISTYDDDDDDDNHNNKFYQIDCIKM